MNEWTPTAVGTLIVIIGNSIVLIIGAIYAGRKLAMIEAHVNSQATSYNAKIEALQNENKLLRETAAANKEIAAVLAQSKLPAI